MTAVPAIYGEVSEAAKAAYAAWMDRLFLVAEHSLDCSDCDVFHPRCAVGATLRAAEQSAWGRFHALKPARLRNA